MYTGFWCSECGGCGRQMYTGFWCSECGGCGRQRCIQGFGARNVAGVGDRDVYRVLVLGMWLVWETEMYTGFCTALEDTGVDVRIILKWVLEKWVGIK